MPLPPPKALPIASVRAAAPWRARNPINTAMLRVQRKSNGMSALSDDPERPLIDDKVDKPPFLRVGASVSDAPLESVLGDYLI